MVTDSRVILGGKFDCSVFTDIKYLYILKHADEQLLCGYELYSESWGPACWLSFEKVRQQVPSSIWVQHQSVA